MRAAAAILLVLLLAGCSDSQVDPSRVRLHIVAGDGQTAPVIDAAPSAAVVPAAALAPSAQVAPITEADLFPEKLVVRAVASGDQSRGELTGPNSGGIAAPGVTVTWRVREAQGCGYPVEVSTLTASNGESVNRWVRGTKAGECHLDVCRVVADTGEVVCDETFAAVQEPGELARVMLPPGGNSDGTWRSSGGIADLLHVRFYDGHNNRISWPWYFEVDTEVIDIAPSPLGPQAIRIQALQEGSGVIHLFARDQVLFSGTVAVEAQSGGTLEFTIRLPAYGTCLPEGFCVYY